MSAAALAILLIAGCAAGEGAEWAGTRETIDGVEVVRNPPEPLHPPTAVEVTELWSSPSPAEEASLGDWELPFAIRVGEDRVYVLDRMGHRVHSLDRATGRWPMSIGRRGGGPGEFERPFGIALLDGEVVVGNGGRATLERFSPAGDYLGSVHTGLLGFSLQTLGDDFLVSGMLGRAGGYRTVSGDGTLRDVTLPASDPALSDLGAGCARVTAGPNDLYRLDCTRPAFQLIDRDGALRRTVLVDRPAQRVSEEAVNAHLDRIRGQMRETGLPTASIEHQVEQQREAYRFDRRMRLVRPERGGSRHAVWEQSSDDLGGGPARLHFFSDDGVFLATAEFATPWSDFEWADGIIYALVRDADTDLVRAVAYRVKLP